MRLDTSKVVVVTNKFEEISRELNMEFNEQRVVNPYANTSAVDPKLYAVYSKLQALLSLLSEMVKEDN